MKDTEYKNSLEERWEVLHRRRSRGRAFTGLLLLVIGVLLLLKTAGLVAFPRWFFTWPMIFIAVGVVSGLRDGFRGGMWLIFLIIGGMFLAQDINPDWHLQRYAWPLVLIAIGLGFILRPRGRCSRWRRSRLAESWEQQAGTAASTATGGTMHYEPGDFIDITAVLGGIKKNVLTKNFRGGDITSFMGGSEVDLTKADFSGTVHLDITTIFGGTKLIVPPTWDVQSEVTAVLGGVDDKRQLAGVNYDPGKVLILDGTCVFGGIEIRSY